MKKLSLKIIYFCFCFFFLNSLARAAGGNEVVLQQNRIHNNIQKGIESAFNLDGAGANSSLQKAIEQEPQNPTGYAFMAMNYYLAYEISFNSEEQQKYQDLMQNYASDAIAKAGKITANNPDDGQAYFAISLAKVVRARLAIKQKKYFLLAQETAKIWDDLEKARNNDLRNFDIYFIMGLLHYHVDQLPGISHFLSSVWVVSGDRQKGMQELQLAAQKGDLLKDLAQSELAAVYLNYEKQPAKALPIIQELKKKYPDNYNFSFGLSEAFSGVHRYQEALDIASEIGKNIQTGKRPYASQLQPRYDHLMGIICFDQGQYDAATGYFQKALKETAPYNARIRVSSLVHMGMIYDVHKNREQAIKCYDDALAIQGGEGSAQASAKKYRENPYMSPGKS
jgi:tetratricopeptide (TPR) repeat protein